MEQHVPTMCVIVCQSGSFRLIDSMGSPWSLTAIERELKLGGKVESSPQKFEDWHQEAGLITRSYLDWNQAPEKPWSLGEVIFGVCGGIR